MTKKTARRPLAKSKPSARILALDPRSTSVKSSNLIRIQAVEKAAALKEALEAIIEESEHSVRNAKNALRSLKVRKLPFLGTFGHVIIPRHVWGTISYIIFGSTHEFLGMEERLGRELEEEVHPETRVKLQKIIGWIKELRELARSEEFDLTPRQK